MTASALPDARFGGVARLYGDAALSRFSRAHVMVIGIGGVGSWVAEALARSGVGRLTLIDLDDICVSNTNRQVHAVEGNIGRLKVTAMAERLRLINPAIDVNEVGSFLTEQNLTSLLSPAPDAVADAIDSVKPKTALMVYCLQQGIPLTCAGGAGGRTDPTRLKVADITRTTHDALLSKVRQKLRSQHGFSRDPRRKFGIECVYSDEPPRFPQPDGTTCETRAVGDGGPVRLDCATGFGASVCVTATAGLVLASRILQRLARPAS